LTQYFPPFLENVDFKIRVLKLQTENYILSALKIELPNYEITRNYKENLKYGKNRNKIISIIRGEHI